MKRNWDVIREVLIEVEEDRIAGYKYGPGFAEPNTDREEFKARHAFLLEEAGFVKGQIVSVAVNRGSVLQHPELTWQGHELLETMRSKPVWDRIKTTAADKGIELSFDAITSLARAAVSALVS